MSHDSLLRSRATIERPDFSTDAGGAGVVNWTLVASDIPCRLEIRRVEMHQPPVGRVTLTEARAHFPAGTDLRPRCGAAGGDRVTIDGIAFDVLGATHSPEQPLLIADLQRAE